MDLTCLRIEQRILKVRFHIHGIKRINLREKCFSFFEYAVLSFFHGFRAFIFCARQLDVLPEFVGCHSGNFCNLVTVHNGVLDDMMKGRAFQHGLRRFFRNDLIDVCILVLLRAQGKRADFGLGESQSGHDSSEKEGGERSRHPFEL